MRLIRFPLSWLLLLHTLGTLSYAKEDAVHGDEADLQMAQESNEAAGKIGDVQGQPNPGYNEGQNPQYPRGNQEDGQVTQGQQRPVQGQDQQIQDPQAQQQGQQNPIQGQQNPIQGQQNSRPIQGQPNPQLQQDPSYQGQGTIPAPNGQDQRGQGTPVQPGVGQTQDQLPPEPPQVKLPKKPRVFPSPTATPTPKVTPTPTFIPAPPPEPRPEPTTRPQPSGPKTDAQRSYESAMQTRWKAAADEIALLRNRGETLQGKKGKAFRESLRTASGNRSMARTKLNQLVRGSSADFDKLKTGVERAFADLDSSIARIRSYFDEPPPP